MSDPYGNSPSKYHHLLSCKPLQVDNIEFLGSISPIWDVDSIERLQNNQWKCLWCNVKSQGINATKILSHVIRSRYMHIKRCRASVYQDHLSINNDL